MEANPALPSPSSLLNLFPGGSSSIQSLLLYADIFSLRPYSCTFLSPALKVGTRVPRIQLTRLLLVCIGPGRRLFCPLLLFQPFYSDP